MRNIRKPKEAPEPERAYLNCHSCNESVARITANLYELRCSRCKLLVDGMAQVSKGRMLSRAEALVGMRLIRSVQDGKIKASQAIGQFAESTGRNSASDTQAFTLNVEARREKELKDIIETRSSAQVMKLANKQDWNDLRDVVLYGVRQGEV